MSNNYLCSKKGFVVLNIVSMIICMILYSKSIFRTTKGFTTFESYCLLYGIMMISIIIALMIQINEHRTIVSWVLNIFMGYGLYTIVSYIDKLKTSFSILLTIIIIVSVLDVLIILFRNNKKPLKNVIKKVFFNSYCIVASGMGIILIIVCVVNCAKPSSLNIRMTLPHNSHMYIKQNEKNILINDKNQGIFNNTQQWSILMNNDFSK